MRPDNSIRCTIGRGAEVENQAEYLKTLELRAAARFHVMPTVLRTGPYRIFFYAGDRDEPPHVHVERDANIAKFWLDL